MLTDKILLLIAAYLRMGLNPGETKAEVFNGVMSDLEAVNNKLKSSDRSGIEQ